QARKPLADGGIGVCCGSDGAGRAMVLPRVVIFCSTNLCDKNGHQLPVVIGIPCLWWLQGRQAVRTQPDRRLRRRRAETAERVLAARQRYRSAGTGTAC